MGKSAEDKKTDGKLASDTISDFATQLHVRCRTRADGLDTTRAARTAEPSG